MYKMYQFKGKLCALYRHIYTLYLYMCTMALDSYIFNLDISGRIGQASGQTRVGHSL